MESAPELTRASPAASDGHRLEKVIEDASHRLIGGVEEAMSATAAGPPMRRTVQRLPGLLRDLVERLRSTGAGTPSGATVPRIELDIATLVIALRLLKTSLYELIDERQVPVTPADMRLVGDWFFDVASAALAAENRRLAGMLDAIPDHMLLYNAEGRIVFVNRAVEESSRSMANMSNQEVLGRRFIDIVFDKKYGEYFEGMLARARTGESITEEVLLPRPDGGGGRWHEYHMRPVYGSDGSVDAVAVASRDTHDRKRTEMSAQLMSKLGAVTETTAYEDMTDAIAGLSIPELADWCLINVIENGKFQRTAIAHRDPTKAAVAKELLRLPSQLHTLSVGESVLAGKSLLLADIRNSSEHSDLVHSQVVQSLDARSAIVVPFVVMGAPVAIATFIMTPESGRRYVAEDLELAHDLARRAGQILENARLQQQLRQSEARFRVTLEHANIAVVETDRDLRIRWIHNTRLRVPDSALLGKTSSEILGPEMGAALDELQRHVLETGEGALRTLSGTTDGKTRHFMVRYEPLRGDGGIVGLTGATVDVTELKEAEEQLARELGFRERMMGILGHDLRNPVSAVLSLAGLMRRQDGMNDKAREQLLRIEQSARRMNEMIGTLLDFTRLRFHGSLPVAVEDVELDELVRGVVAELQAAHRRREIELSASGNLRGAWDPGRIAQLLSNLGSNALSHGADGAPVTVAVAGEGDTVRLSVSNRGSVIPPEHVERMFEPFQQGLAPSGNGHRGLGLGLFIVREIVRAHGGTIDVRSGGELTTFAVTLPRTAVPS